MEFMWQQHEEKQAMKDFLGQRGIGSRFFRYLRQNGGQILINGRLTNGPTNVVRNDQVTVRLPVERADPRVAISHQPLTILAEDNNWLVINKPAGLTAVPGPTNRVDTVVNRVKGHLIDAGAQDQVPHIITRLDRFTSGIVLIAKHRLAQNLVQTQPLDKVYLALVNGRLEQAHDLIDAPLGRRPNEFKQSVLETGKKAQTEYWLERYLPALDASLVRVKLLTGRTHQIRAHFAYLGRPLLGDELYQGPLDRGIKRQALHASRLSFFDPFTKIVNQYEAELPSDFQKLLV
ncbi:RluA family pseudouridine synthase [Loigolactobacillus backii]|uniref:RluA family pseudouridine synthase n=1 Tax=Loigolactobacillus backii TaxID=375175 RepID=UPI0007F0C109|nr:RluA family pseudouridine synthase [Loigolactobacillus backii]ANK59632.1 RNA pseudouridine synthase [Loigolactobacillus backii]ANK64626.1 RNA pseudouridine synthase [Loigolactobacillus backii]ANK66978.1 RNA pseudouridine synthase [Loigolactobacillus backii]MDA5388707.1 RluA family pseudouridine synthase [Loigolactobacillus backii]MDA5391172.1 RluA family pseudouridine synthase [Loigolactobacillus backii]